MKFSKSKRCEIARISELLLRANRITTGHKYLCNELRDILLNKNNKVYSVYVQDKYSDFGLVGSFAYAKDELKYMVVSCRVAERGVENKMIDLCRKYGVTRALYINTGKNEKFIKSLENSKIKVLMI